MAGILLAVTALDSNDDLLTEFRPVGRNRTAS